MSCCPISTKKTVHTGKPRWLKQRLPKGGTYEKIRRLVHKSELCTVCQEARCPNQFECFAKGTATFMLMGESCTRNCRFCAVSHQGATPLDPEEPGRIAQAVGTMGLKYAVLTSVTRDDLDDGGADHFVQTIAALKRRCPEIRVEVLIPDFQGAGQPLQHLCAHPPAVINHNVETVAGLYAKVRPQAIYERSLELLQRVKQFNPSIITKSGLMLGLGESRSELGRTMQDIRATGCDLLTLGQYLQPTKHNISVSRYLPPEEFAEIGRQALELGFKGVASGPHVRSSYQAESLYQTAVKNGFSEIAGNAI
ncbi:MAG: lipoyl synthase [Desulfobulbus sp.]|nr:MAG: lipoyl synthase [Desulfobulbus sp.]